MSVIINTFPKFTFCLACIVHTTWAKHNIDLAHSVAIHKVFGLIFLLFRSIGFRTIATLDGAQIPTRVTFDITSVNTTYQFASKA